MKRIISLLLVFTALIAVFTVFTVIITALALTSCGNGKYDSQGLCYEENSDGTYSVSVGRAKELTVLTVPATFEGKAVTRIAASFWWRRWLWRSWAWWKHFARGVSMRPKGPRCIWNGWIRILCGWFAPLL